LVYDNVSTTIFKSIFFLQQDLKELKEDVKRDLDRTVFSALSSSNKPDKYYKESTNSAMPKIGSRVRRGPDWKWKHQDSEGPGTIIGHAGEFKRFTTKLCVYCQIILSC